MHNANRCQEADNNNVVCIHYLNTQTVIHTDFFSPLIFAITDGAESTAIEEEEEEWIRCAWS